MRTPQGGLAAKPGTIRTQPANMLPALISAFRMDRMTVHTLAVVAYGSTGSSALLARMFAYCRLSPKFRFKVQVRPARIMKSTKQTSSTKLQTSVICVLWLEAVRNIRAKPSEALSLALYSGVDGT